VLKIISIDMNNMTERQKLILTLVIHEHIRTAAPVGSQYLVERYKLNMSSATIRNEMAALTDLNYLRQPHTSAGRVPSEDGYRFFVGRLLRESDLPDKIRHTILAVSVLAQQSQAASLITAPHSDEVKLKHLELIATRGRQVLMVLVLVGGDIHQRILSLGESYSQKILSKVADQITHSYLGKDVAAIELMIPRLSGLEQEVTAVVIDEMKQINLSAAGEIFMDGITNVLAEPEFSGSDEAKRALQVLEERSLLQELLSQPFLTDNIGGVQVLIGGEGTREELRPWSMVLSRYGSPGLATGTLGVLGPMRMSYSRNISTVRYLSRLLSDLVSDTLGE
jgi:heat-inducible transcriptional repressor